MDACIQNMTTGEIEVVVTPEQLQVLNASQCPPFAFNAPNVRTQCDDVIIYGAHFIYCIIVQVREALRMQYRYLDLRRPALQHVIRLRAQVAAAVRSVLANQFGECMRDVTYVM